MKNPACKFDFFGRLPFVNKNIRSFLRFGAFLLILVLVVLLANAVLIQTDTYSALPLAELKAATTSIWPSSARPSSANTSTPTSSASRPA